MPPSKPSGVKRSAPVSSAASPAFAGASTPDGTTSKRQKRDGIASGKDALTPAAASLLAQSQSTGTHINTQVMYAIEFLKAKGTPKTLQEILNHISLQHAPEEQHKNLVDKMKVHSQVQFIPTPKAKAAADQQTPAWRTGTYQFKPTLPGVTSKVKLLEYLQSKKDASGTQLKDIKDGWPDCDEAINELEAEHKIIGVRTKREQMPRYIWLDNPELHHKVEDDFREMWTRVALPPAEEMPRKLKALGQKATSDGPKHLNIGHKAPPKRKKASRVQKKFENEHMRNIFEQHKRK
ncbi:transcription initiation factor IIE, beta subunit [Hypomontagnella submonticulosa]|nr:transcription initiation factor IIE, beta subunit [Hypomontagnella submonticulosa]